MEFTVYIRLFIESFQRMLLSSISEVNAWRTDSVENIISLGFAFVILATCVLGTLFIVLLIWKGDLKSSEKFEEAFIGLKDKESSKTYILVSIFLRKLLYIGIMISLMSMVDIIYL